MTIDHYPERSRIVDENGDPFTTSNPLPVQETSDPKDFMLEVPRGNISGISCINKFGSNSVVASGTTEDVWDGGGVYSFPATATITHLRQATDQVGTDGGATIEVQGLDASWDLTIQTADLDGTDTTTEVALGTALIRVFRLKVNADVVLADDIWVGATGVAAGTAKGLILTPHNQTLMAIYTIPNGKTGYMISYYCDFIEATGKDPKSVGYRLWAADRDNSYEFQIKHEKGIPQSAAGFQHEFRPYLKFTQKTDIKIDANPDDKDAHVHAGFDLILVDN